MFSPNDMLKKELEDLLISAIWTHQIQEKQTIFTLRTESFLKVMQIIISAFIGSTAIVDLINSTNNGKYVIAISSTILVITSTLLKSNTFSHKADLHKLAAANLWLKRQEISASLVDFSESHIDSVELRSLRDKFISELHEISKQAPKADGLAIYLAKKALKVDAVSTVSEEERELLIPSYLKKEV